MSQQFSKEKPPILPDGGRWEAVYDEEYKQYYYVDLQNNNQSQWNAPEGTRTVDALQQSSNPPDKGLFSSLTSTGGQQQQNGQQQNYQPQQQNYQQQNYQPQQQNYQQQNYQPQQQNYQPQQQNYQQQNTQQQQQANNKQSSFPTGTVMGVAGGALGAMLLKNAFSNNGRSHHNRPNSRPQGNGFFGGGNGGGFGGGGRGGRGGRGRRGSGSGW